MMGFLRGRRGLVTVCLAASLSGGSAARAQKVSTDYDHNAPFSDYRTFSFLKVQTENPLNVSRVRDGISSELSKQGLQEVPSGGSVAIAAVGGLRNVQQYNTFYDGLGPGWGWGGWRGRGWGAWGGGPETSTTTVQNVQVGTLRVDMYDGNSHQLVWRGMASDQLSDKPQKNTDKLNKALNKMFDKFPPKTKQ